MIKGTIATFGALVFFVGAWLVYASATKSGKRFNIRRVAGIQAIDEAIDRCTEMGRPVHFATGTGALDSSMIASFAVMSYIATKCAQMDTGLIVSAGLPEIYQISEGVVRQSYVEAGKKDAFRPENVRYLTSAVAAYEIAVDGLLHRENPGANLMFGPFNAEAMMIAERGNRLGLVQIAGTNSFLSLARFVATCDYVLIGDELYAAAAYLFKDKEPERLNQVLAQDVLKIAAFLTILAGTLLNSFGNKSIANLLAK